MCVRVAARGPAADANHVNGQKFGNSVEISFEDNGIGLSITKRLVALHRGEITIDSEEGSGTNVRVQLPVGGRT